MDAVGLADHEEYLDHLLLHPDEFTQLFNTICINVTSFFRDSDAWARLQQDLLPPLLARREGQPIRIWSAGCASGEEACTIAMVLAESLGIDQFRERVKVYATDVDEEALAHARQAAYTAREVEAVPEDLREKYFDQVSGNRFVFRKELRRSLIFGRNDLVQDAPISHVDVLLCRNTLMYFNAETQAQILNRLHFALQPDGLLVLGKAEMLLSHSAYFRPIELRQRIFQKISTEPRDRRLAVDLMRSAVPPDQLETIRLRHSALMSSAAAQLVLDSEGRLALSNHRAMNLFGLSTRDIGQPIQDLEVSYRPLELRAHIEQATSQRRPVWARDVELHRGTADRLIFDVQFVPLSDETGERLGVTVIFNDVTQHRQLQDELLYANRQLETAYEELQSTNEELETTNEELQSTVEELETTNEELQSTNEELETMNEELQSMNDELQLTNDALRERQGELDRLSQFTASVLGSMSTGVAVVDADLRVLAWNATAEDLWGVRMDEAVGEHLMNLDIGLPVEQLLQPIRAQLTDGESKPQSLAMDALNRRGRNIGVRVTITPIRDHGDPNPAVVVVMDPQDDGSR